ncbi:RNA-binding (RRM/RBD/RNP motifs) family protein [Citrus sinensis]|uniref:RNA-binding (RRM/RBD/RNP motifs) family protein n=1 Tax=Citrus sinensis TaxID=2711 RepID=A0ACB8P2L6_CITSI|nr:RNA-binding (RRM/RBD/RNP motifs) family protein [Citrus sinensis]
MGSKSKSDNPHTGDGASPGKIFIGGLPKDTTYATFNKHFGKYGDITDSVIMKDRYTGQPRGFGFITYADPSVVDKVIEDTHIINGKQVEIKRTIPKGSGQSKDFKTKKIFVGGIPSSVSEDELKNFFSKYGKVLEHQIIRDHETNRSRGFGFVIFDSEEVVDEMLSKGNMIDMAGTQVEIKKAEPKKSSNPPPPPSYASNSRGRSFNDGFGGFGKYGGGYGGFGGSSLGGYRGEPSLGYSGRFGPYGGGFGSSYGGSGLGGYGRGGEGYGSYGGSGYGGGYDSGPGTSYGAGGGLYGRGGYSGSSRYHPYARS